MNITLPDLCLVVLVGPSGSGKSTFARQHFLPTQVLSSDTFRAMLADDENDQSVTAEAFELLHDVAGRRLRAGRLTVVDATNVQDHARAQLVAVAKAHDVLPVAIVLNTPEGVCWERTEARPDRDFGRNVVTRQSRDLRRSIGRLQREGFRSVHVINHGDVVERIGYERLYNDRRDLTGPFDIIGDVHGCHTELVTLLRNLGYAVRADGAEHPDGRTAVFVGDLVDRGPDTPGVLRLVMGMVAAGTALCVAGNHEEKLLRKLRGRTVRVSHGLAETLEQLAASPVDDLEPFLSNLISHYVLDGGKLVVAHAGCKEAYQGRASGRVRAFCLYGDTTGETDEYGLPVRYPWAQDYRGRAAVVYGHTPTPRAEWINNTICLDTGAVFGGALTALRYPERQLVSVPAEREYYAPARPLKEAGPATNLDALSLADLTGRRVLDTGYGRVTVAAENAAAALEVMSRFAIDPRWLRWLPPTMAPSSTSDVDGYLEHPARALADYAKVGVTDVVCQEKHMGSRAVVLVARTSAAASAAFGIEGDGAVWTRTGRPFFADAAPLLARVRAAVDAAGLWEELGTDWLMLDTEIMPWSAKAQGLIRDQYAPVGAAAGAALPAALNVLDATLARDLADPGAAPVLRALRAKVAERDANAAGFRAVIDRYCWPVDGLSGLRVAPFAVLAGAGFSGVTRDNGWHLALADRLVAADPTLFATTRRLVTTVSDVDTVTDWWLALTGEGGEGMVVKPLAGTVPARPGTGKSIQPGLKCRGREYLRIIYGPDYTSPDQLSKLRQRGLGRKWGLALREYGLGVAALERLAAGEPLWRCHELVFAILACESEPVDPRL
ncbi:polynucleotide kinase-phosphatase [Virgisporangium aurantiacum]|uniref:Polynucleotide kinase-phosphatase n=1 Tax=Virgisporangium aurantiacum TaxID=175570 RepID=A0A8J3ZDP0_9ACTN|nr:polynucleotide kinase-phosphatase [Virgisporangium aurantiacum]GIJ59736.1 polynucleotide kinase-phosphatase [Virgisporangium aurantiacum]